MAEAAAPSSCPVCGAETARLHRASLPLQSRSSRCPSHLAQPRAVGRCRGRGSASVV